MIKFFVFNSNQWSNEKFEHEIKERKITKDNIVAITQNYNNYTIFYDELSEEQKDKNKMLNLMFNAIRDRLTEDYKIEKD